MSRVFDAARVSVFLADYISADPSGKVNALGLGINIVALQPGTSPPVSAPMAVAVQIEIPRKLVGEQFAWALELRDLTTDSAVQVARAPDGRMDALRVQQLAKVDAPNVPGIVLPDEVPCRVQVNMAFLTGLQLTEGHAYEWRLTIDGQRRKGWSATFVTLGQPRPPIFGGQDGPSDIANMPPSVEDDPIIVDVPDDEPPASS